MMTNDIDIDLIGDKELFAALNALDFKTQQKELKKVVGNAAQTLVKPTKAVIPRRTTNLTQGGSKKWHPPGTGKRSIGKKAGKSKRSAVVFVGPRTNTGNYKTDGYFLKWWERGTRFKVGTQKIESVYRANLKNVENHMIKSLRIIWTRAMKKAR